jgi:hypothetical protein
LAALAIFREYNEAPIALFPELPGSRKPRECLAYSDAAGFHAVDYENVMYHSRPAKTKVYRDLLHELKKAGYKLNVIQQASFMMHDRRKKASETYVNDNPDGSALGLAE